MKMEPTECSETSENKIQGPEYYPEERIKQLYVLYTKQLFPATFYSHWQLCSWILYFSSS